jgi:NAD(P)-dependent dehydrogenase (short-subunit alcohol dehydrogenase family)
MFPQWQGSALIGGLSVRALVRVAFDADGRPDEAEKGFPTRAGYCAAKFGVVGLSKASALDYADKNIRVNVVSPGIIETPMVDRFSGGTEEERPSVIAQDPIGRMGRPEETAATVPWLCSDLAAFTTGANVVVDGGQTT